MSGRSRTVSVGTGRRGLERGALSTLSFFSLRNDCIEEMKVRDV